MSFLATAVRQMIAGMSADERREAILSVAGEALAQMSEGERVELTRQLFGLLLERLTPEEGRAVATQLARALEAGEP